MAPAIRARGSSASIRFNSAINSVPPLSGASATVDRRISIPIAAISASNAASASAL